MWEKMRGLKIYSENIRGLKILGFSEENTRGGYSQLKMNTPLIPIGCNVSYPDCPLSIKLFIGIKCVLPRHFYRDAGTQHKNLKSEERAHQSLVSTYVPMWV